MSSSTSHFESISVSTATIACDGGKGALGHPTVYLDASKTGEATCPYCSRHYVFASKKSA